MLANVTWAEASASGPRAAAAQRGDRVDHVSRDGREIEAADSRTADPSGRGSGSIAQLDGGEALRQSVGPCPNPQHDCLTEGAPGCSDAGCCLLICSLDGYCCNIGWDLLCVALASKHCEPPSLCPSLCPADLNRSCQVDGADLGALLADWGTIGTCADLSGDGPVGGADLGLLLASWGSCEVSCAALIETLDEAIDDIGAALADAWWLDPDMERQRIARAIFIELAIVVADAALAELLWAAECGAGGDCPSPENMPRFKLKIEDARKLLLRNYLKSLALQQPGLSPQEAGQIRELLLVQLVEVWDRLFGARDQLTREPLEPCPDSLHDCCTTGAPGCTDGLCCAAVCAIDPLCCTVAWNSFCVAIAETICGIDCPEVCPPSDHDCFTPGGPGCSDLECCTIVCAADAFCCEVAWDAICIAGALRLCAPPSCLLSCPPRALSEPEPCGDDTDGGCNVPTLGDSSCCVPHGEPGCDDSACQAAVCGVDAFCCRSAWDSICANEALMLCPELCVPAAPSFAPLACDLPVCGTAWADGDFRDTDWYQIELFALPCTAVTFTIQTTLPMVIGIVDTGGVPDCRNATTLNPFAIASFCGTASFEACLAPGTYWFFAAPNSFTGFPCGTINDYVITLEGCAQ
jgi:hypothetical protein